MLYSILDESPVEGIVINIVFTKRLFDNGKW